MTSSADVIVQVEAGGRPLLRTVDSILRQRVTPASIALVKPDNLPAPLVTSAAGRLSAIVLDGGPYPGVSLNAAVRGGHGQYIVVLRAGLVPDETGPDEMATIDREVNTYITQARLGTAA